MTVKYNMELVSCLSDLVNNMHKFKSDIKEKKIPLKKLKSFYAWFYIKELDLFGPSKYIKYKNMSYDMYYYFDVVRQQYIEESEGKYFHGKVSDIQKNNWFTEVKDIETIVELKERLARFFESNGYSFSLKKNTKFYIR